MVQASGKTRTQSELIICVQPVSAMARCADRFPRIAGLDRTRSIALRTYLYGFATGGTKRISIPPSVDGSQVAAFGALQARSTQFKIAPAAQGAAGNHSRHSHKPMTARAFRLSFRSVCSNTFLIEWHSQLSLLCPKDQLVVREVDMLHVPWRHFPARVIHALTAHVLVPMVMVTDQVVSTIQ